MAMQMPHRVDAALSGVKMRAAAIGLDEVYKELGLLRPPLKEISIEEQLRRRLLLDLDGSSQSTRLYWGLLSNSVVLKQDTKNCNWYSDRLRDQVHIFRVRRDLTDLPLQVRRVRLRPSLARSVARRSARLARRWLSHEDAMHYLARVVLAVAEAQRKALGHT
ncbi:Poglut2, partial [Symbiodinium pilosum]